MKSEYCFRSRWARLFLLSALAICGARAFALADAVANTYPPIIQGDVFSECGQALAQDAAGNRYVIGTFSNALDFNPGAGLDAKPASPAPDITYVFVTRFNADGSYGWTQIFGGSSPSFPEAVVLSADAKTVYVSGIFDSPDAQIGLTGPSVASAGGFDAFVFALDAATGAPKSGFGLAGSGIQTLGGTANDQGYGLAVLGQTLYLAGAFSSFDFQIGGAGPQTSAIGSRGFDAFVVALDGTTGAAIGTFGTNGVQTFGGFGDDRASGVAATPSALYVNGSFDSFSAQIGGTGPAVGAAGFDAFVLSLDPVTGAANTAFGVAGGVVGVGGAAGAVAAGPNSGVQTFGAIQGSTASTAIIASGSTIYTTGYFNGVAASVGGVSSPSVDSVATNVFVLALDSGTGVPLSTFGLNGTGVQTFGGNNYDQGFALALKANSLFVCGNFSSDSAQIGFTGTSIPNSGAQTTNDGFVLALDPVTGAGLPAFGKSGIQTIDGSSDEFAFGAAISGNVLTLAGNVFSPDVGFGALGAFDGTNFEGLLAPLDATTGALNRAPTALALSNNVVPEHLPIGLAIGTFSTTDPDAGNTFKYTLVPGVGSTDNASFGINSASLTAAIDFDFLSRTTYSIRVRSTDQGGQFIEKAFTINVSDVNQAPLGVFLSNATLLSQSPAGTTVGTLSTVDVDVGSTFTYTFAAGDGDTDNVSFALVGSELQTAAVLDYNTQNAYSIRVRSTDNGGLFFEQVFTINLIVPGTTGVKNVSDDGGTKTVTNPDSGLGITVQDSNSGLITLSIDVSSLTKGRALIDVNTAWGDIPGRASTSKGLTPSHLYTKHGIYVVTVTAADHATGNTLGKMRKTLTISTTETGELPPSSANNNGRKLKARVTQLPKNNTISLTAAKGRFSFNASHRDEVTYTGRIKLPKGLDTTQPVEFSFAIGNIISTATIQPRGNGIAGETDVAAPGSLLRYLKISYGVRSGGITKGGEIANITATIAASGLVGAGFDTEGISNRSAGATPGRSTPRSVQVAMLIDGVAYESIAPVTFAVTKDSAFGTISGRK